MCADEIKSNRIVGKDILTTLNGYIYKLNYSGY